MGVGSHLFVRGGVERTSITFMTPSGTPRAGPLMSAVHMSDAVCCAWRRELTLSAWVRARAPSIARRIIATAPARDPFSVLPALLNTKLTSSLPLARKLLRTTFTSVVLTSSRTRHEGSDPTPLPSASRAFF